MHKFCACFCYFLVWRKYCSGITLKSTCMAILGVVQCCFPYYTAKYIPRLVIENPWSIFSLQSNIIFMNLLVNLVSCGVLGLRILMNFWFSVRFLKVGSMEENFPFLCYKICQNTMVVMMKLKRIEWLSLVINDWHSLHIYCTW